MSDLIIRKRMKKKVMVLVLLGLSSALSQEDCKTLGKLDPCYRYNSREIPYLDSRHPSVRYSSTTSDVNKYCDLHALNDGIWYISDYNITQTCVQQESCGSRLPIWLNGSIPSVDEGAVNRSGCVRTYDSCCEDSYNLMIKNCGFYTVYCFWDLPNGCPQRYCFDVNLTRTTTTSTSSTSTTTTLISTTTTESGPLAGTGNEGTNDKHVIIGLSVTVAAAVFAVVVLAGFIVVLKKKLATSVLPAAGEKIAIY